VRLFADRVRLRDRDFAVDARNADLVARICRRLDGIPLAIELAAARASVLALEQILEKLGDRFRLLTGGDRASPPRRQTLKATLDWSYALLSDDERRVFERLSVFAGGCTLDAAEQVVEGSLEPRSTQSRSEAPCTPWLTSSSILDHLSRLVDKSLVVADRRSGEARYRMLETIREYALERLRESGDEERVRERHAAWFVDFALRAKVEIDGPEQGIWMDRLQAEYDNLRAVLRRAAEGGDWVTVARVGNAVFQFWGTRGYWSEGRETVRAAVESGCELPPPVLAGALYALGALEMRRAEYAQAELHLGQALEIRRRLGDSILAASAMRMLGTIHLRRGDIDRAAALYEESLAIYRAAGDQVRTAWALSGLGLAAMDAGDWDRARARMEESLAISRKVGAARHVASAIHNLAEIMYRTGDLDGAEALAGECLALAIEIDDRQLTNVTHVLLAHVAVDRGELGRAGELFTAALTTSRELGDLLVVALALEGMAAMAVAAGDAPLARARLEEAAALRAAGGFVPSFVEQAAIDACRAAAAGLDTG
jgi:tetratricopeptide (TPR) repeat protein